MIFDSHIHTRFSKDSEMEAAEAISAASLSGIGLVFTEHVDFGAPGFIFSPEDYWAEYEPLRGEGLSLGVELGLAPGEGEMARSFLSRAPFDEVIGSIHFIDGLDIYEKEPGRSPYEDRSQGEVYLRYFSLMAEEIRQNPYVDVLGHIDYIARYAPYEHPGIDYPAFADAIDEVLRAAIETDTALELNTRRFGDIHALKELAPVFARYRTLGGRFVTIGSDAHSKGSVGLHLALARDFAYELELTVVTFRERRRVGEQT